jgi:hypothetical protein
MKLSSFNKLSAISMAGEEAAWRLFGLRRLNVAIQLKWRLITLSAMANLA